MVYFLCNFYELFFYFQQEKRRIETLYKKTLIFREHLIRKQLEELQEKAKANEFEVNIQLLLPLFSYVFHIKYSMRN